MDFYTTRMGQTFFEHQVPSLIKAINENTEAIKNSANKKDAQNATAHVYGVVIKEDNNTVDIQEFADVFVAMRIAYAVCDNADDALELKEILQERM